MLLEGKTLEGKTFSLKKLHGKVVLVDFWSSTHAPCMKEIENIKDQYEKYHDKGFEVVGVNVGRWTRTSSPTSPRRRKSRGTICRNADLHARDADVHAAEYYGVSAIPVLILVGRDGKVVSIHARGPELGTLIERRLAAAATRRARRRARATTRRNSRRKRRSGVGRPKEKTRGGNARQGPQVPHWTDTSGDFHKKAKFRGVVAGKVRLELEDGSITTVPLENLSDEDQKYIRERKH